MLSARRTTGAWGVQVVERGEGATGPASSALNNLLLHNWASDLNRGSQFLKCVADRAA